MNTLPSLLCYCLSAPPPACQFKPKMWNKGRPWSTSGSSRFSHRGNSSGKCLPHHPVLTYWSGSSLHTCRRSPGSLRASLGLPYWRTAVDNPSYLQEVIVLRDVGPVPVYSGLPSTPEPAWEKPLCPARAGRWHWDMWG